MGLLRLKKQQQQQQKQTNKQKITKKTLEQFTWLSNRLAIKKEIGNLT